MGLHSGHYSNHLDRDCEAGRNTLLVCYPKYPLMCEICAVAICDRGFSEERTIPQLVATDTRTLNALFTHTLRVVDFAAVVLDTILYCRVL